MRINNIWISLLEVKPLKDSEYFGKFKRAYVNGLIYANSKSEAEKQFNTTLNKMGFKLISVEDTEKYANRIKKYTVAKEIQDIYLKIKENKQPQFGIFHTSLIKKNKI